jgi:N-acetylmuramoyl-L-alanine amidase
MEEEKYPIEVYTSPNRSSRKSKDISLLVIHWTSGGFEGALSWMTTKGVNASAHYLISKTGKIARLVEEKDKAWHCGVSSHPDFGVNLNEVSIGIELEGPPSKVKETEWKKEQLDSCIWLCKDIQKRYPTIKITDHSSISPGRKIDVKGGEDIDKFPWEWFVKQTGIKEA